MENTERKIKKTIQKMDALKENVSHVHLKMDGNQFLTAWRRYHLTMPQVFDSFTKNLDLASPAVRYFRIGSPMAGTFLFPDDPVTPSNDSSKYRTARTGSGIYGFSFRESLSFSPLSTLDNLEKVPKVRYAVVYGITSKGDDDVLVMDDVKVMWKLGGRSALSFSLSLSLSSGITLRSEMSNTRSSGCKCKASDEKEDLRSAHYSAKNVAGGKKNKKSRSRKMGGLSAEERNAYGLRMAELVMEGKKPLPPPGSPNDPRRAGKVVRDSPVTEKNWLPEDDGIEVVLPNFPTDKTLEREDVDAYIRGVLYGPPEEFNFE